MNGIRYGDDYVFPYSSMFHTRSFLLKEIYCESHRYEPWAVNGINHKIGRYVFPNVLYIKAEERDELLRRMIALLGSEPDYTDRLIKRFDNASGAFRKALVRAYGGDLSRKNIEQLIDGNIRVLSCGLFKEVFEYPQALEFLSLYMPVSDLRNPVLALYQPLCIPHFLKFQMKLCFFSRMYAFSGDRKWIYRCMDKAAYLSCFFMEDTPLDNPKDMEKQMLQVMAGFEGDAEKIGNHRMDMIKRHRDAVSEAIKAGNDILQVLDEFGVYSLGSKVAVINCIRFIQFIATYEELKHIYSVQAAKIFRKIMDLRHLDIEETGIGTLLENCPPRESLPQRDKLPYGK